MNEEQFQELLARLIEALEKEEPGTEEYKKILDELERSEKLYLSYQDDLRQNWQVNIEQEKLRKDIWTSVGTGILIVGVTGFLTFWSTEMPITNKIAESILLRFLPKV